MSTTVIMGLQIMRGGGGAHAASPYGIYIAVDAYTSADVNLVMSGSAIAPLFGHVSCSGGTCTGGVTGIYISVDWSQFQNVKKVVNNYTVELDTSGSFATLMNNIYGLEHRAPPSVTFTLSLGLKTGEHAAYNVLDIYAASSGNPLGTDPNYYNVGPAQGDEVENHCAFIESGGLITNSGANFGTLGMPEQCVLHTESGQPKCVPQPRIWGSDTYSITNNPFYQKAFTTTLQDAVYFVNGKTGFSTAPGHDVQALKLSGIGDFDEEISIAGNPGLPMPTTMSGSTTTTFTCGYTAASNAEEVWTDQTSGGTYAFETSIVEATWEALINKEATIVNADGSGFAYIFDLLGDTNLPPVGPAHCGASTSCTYTPPGSTSSLSEFTTGETEYLLNYILERILFGKSVSLQNQGLTNTKPDNLPGAEANYSTIEIPCAMNAYDSTQTGSYPTSIGYQSGGGFSTGSDKLAYIGQITNAAAFGAQYVELKPQDLANFINDTTDTVTFNGISNYGSTTAQNMNMISTTINAALPTMATNEANFTEGTLCPLGKAINSVTGATLTIPWNYPLTLD